MSTLFSKIAAGEIPSYKCAENDKFFAFLDINPVAPGHTLVIPRQEIDYILHMSDGAGRDWSRGEPCPHPPHPHAKRGRHRLQTSRKDERRRTESRI